MFPLKIIGGASSKHLRQPMTESPLQMWSSLRFGLVSLCWLYRLHIALVPALMHTYITIITVGCRVSGIWSDTLMATFSELGLRREDHRYCDFTELAGWESCKTVRVIISYCTFPGLLKLWMIYMQDSVSHVYQDNISSMIRRKKEP